MSTRKLFNLFSFTFLLFVLIGCSTNIDATNNDEINNADDKKTELKIAYSAQPPTLDPQVNIVIATSDMMRQVFETLLTVDEDYNIQPMLAKSFEQSDDGKTITFHLREGVLFHNNEEMKADDVVASMNRWKESTGSREQFTDAVFEATDDYTVVLTLQEAFSTVLPALAHGGAGFAAIMPKEVNEAAGADGVSEYIGTGPFTFTEWKQDQYVHLEKFADYQALDEKADGLTGKKEALVNDIYFMIVPDASTRIAGIQSGEYDIAHSIPLDDAEKLDVDENIVNHQYSSAYLGIAINKKQGLFSDVRAREALAIALTNEDILQASYANEKYYNLDHNMMMTHQHEQWYSDIGKNTYNKQDTDTAKELLDEVEPGAKEITIMTTRDYESQYNAAVVIQQQLEEIGITVHLEIYDWATLLEKMYDETAYDLFVIEDFPGSNPSANSYLLKHSPGWTDSPELDELLKDFKSQPTLEDAKLLYDDLQAWYWDYIPFIKIGDSLTVSSTRSTVKNFQYHDGLILWNVSNDR